MSTTTYIVKNDVKNIHKQRLKWLNLAIQEQIRTFLIELSTVCYNRWEGVIVTFQAPREDDSYIMWTVFSQGCSAALYTNINVNEEK